MGCGPSEFTQGGVLDQVKITDSTMQGGTLSHVTGTLDGAELTDPTLKGTPVLSAEAANALAAILEPLLSLRPDPAAVAAAFSSCRNGLALAPGAPLVTCEDLNELRVVIDDKLAALEGAIDDDVKLAICEALQEGCGGSGGGSGGSGGGSGDDACCPANWTTGDVNTVISKILSRLVNALISADANNCLRKGADNLLFTPCSSGGGGGSDETAAPGAAGAPATGDDTFLPLAVFGGRTALLGAPVAWVKHELADGSTAYLPAFKLVAATP